MYMYLSAKMAYHRLNGRIHSISTESGIGPHYAPDDNDDTHSNSGNGGKSIEEGVGARSE